MKNDAYPIDPTQRLRDSPRCTATAKSTRQRCRNPSKQNWNVCRLHGAGGGAPRGKAHPNYKHGMRTNEWTETRKQINELLRKLGDFE